VGLRNHVLRQDSDTPEEWAILWVVFAPIEMHCNSKSAENGDILGAQYAVDLTGYINRCR